MIPFSSKSYLRPQPFAEILFEEQQVLDPSAFPDGQWQPQLDELHRQINRAERTALCLSGGGIRSAAFSFGVVQRLASVIITTRKGEYASLLTEFDYLSTVSGGGYIGSWISTWLYRRRLQSSGPTVVERLNSRDIEGTEAEPIVELRRNALYMAPHLKAFSADVWDDIACVGRNLVLNWFVILPAIAAAVLFVQAIIAYFVTYSAAGLSAALNFGVAAVCCAVTSLAYTAMHIPTRWIWKTNTQLFILTDLSLWIVASLLLLFAAINLDSSPWRNAFYSAGWPAVRIFGLIAAIVIAAALFGMVWASTWSLDKLLDSFKNARGGILGLLVSGQTDATTTSTPLADSDPNWSRGPISWIVAGAIFGMLCFFAVGLIANLDELLSPVEARLVELAFGVFYLGGSRLLVEAIFAGGSEKLSESDVNLEWLSRSGGYFLLWFTILALVLACIGFGPHLIGGVIDRTIPGYAALFGGATASGALAAAIGTSSDKGPLPSIASAARKYLSLDQLALVAALIFALCLIVGLSTLFDQLLFGSSFWHFKVSGIAWGRITVVFLALTVVAATASYFVNVNRFSLHGLYRNRLTRTFLGTLRPREERDLTRDTFTDYDGRDNPRIYQLWPSTPGSDLFLKEATQSRIQGDWQPLHVVNVTVNLAATKNMAWQERKAASFTISPLHAGSWVLQNGEGAYLSTRYHNNMHSYGGTPGLSLGTSMAISGAALNSNMGYYTSPGISFLMTLFNVRLGWWLPNPANRGGDYSRTSPKWSLASLLKEMFGGTNETSPWLLLSDGGHFDNTGLYEMVRRQCRIIVVVDAGADATYSFSDIGRTLTKIQVDLGVRIDFKGFDGLKERFSQRPTPAQSAPYWATGYIRYSERTPSLEDGIILYIKAGLHGTEPMSVLSYGLTNPQFPHDTTLNQFYEETQFESYRALGYEITNQAMIASGMVKPGSSQLAFEQASKTLRQIIAAL